MKTNQIIMWVAILLIIVIGVVFFTNSKSEQKEASNTNEQVKSEEEKTPELSNDNGFAPVGSYEAYTAEKIAEKSKTSRVVLFFRASWCPTCRALNSDILSHVKNIPGDITILDVDYDNSKELKQKYGVTYQHTLVQVDGQGNMVKKWKGSPTLAELVQEVQ